MPLLPLHRSLLPERPAQPPPCEMPPLEPAHHGADARDAGDLVQVLVVAGQPLRQPALPAVDHGQRPGPGHRGGVPGVVDVHDLHAWTITSGMPSLSAHVTVTDAALEHTGEGEVTETEKGDEESLYEVEVRLDDGSQVDVQLDENFEVVSADPDSDTSEDGD